MSGRVSTLLGLDPGLATFGLVALDLGSQQCTEVAAFASDQHPSIARGWPGSPEVANDRVRRTRELRAWLVQQLDALRPVAVFAEAMSFPPGQVPAIMMSLAWGVLVAELDRLRIPLSTPTPRGWRQYLVPRMYADKHSTQERESAAHREAIRRVPSFATQSRGVPRVLQPHVLDALGVACWGLNQPGMR